MKIDHNPGESPRDRPGPMDYIGTCSLCKLAFYGHKERICNVCSSARARREEVVTVTTWLDEAMRLADDLIEVAWSAGVDTEQTPSSHTEELAAIREPVDAARAALLAHLRTK